MSQPHGASLARAILPLHPELYHRPGHAACVLLLAAEASSRAEREDKSGRAGGAR